MRRSKNREPLISRNGYYTALAEKQRLEEELAVTL
jgi:hypothetical protein